MNPRVDVDDWKLRVHGNVDREVTLTYDDLLAMPLFEQYVTIACVSNKVGDDLIGNALWTGVDLREVLDMAGVQPEGEQIVGRSVDGFTAGFPTTWAMDPERQPMIAIGMNGQPLPRRSRLPGPPHHPRPLRLRQRHQVAERDRAHRLGGVRRLLDPAQLGQGGAHPDAVTHRHASSGARPRGRHDRAHRRRGLGARPRRAARSRWPSMAASGRRPRSPIRSTTPPGCSGSCPGTTPADGRASTRSRSARPMATAWCRLPRSPRPPRWRARPPHHPGQASPGGLARPPDLYSPRRLDEVVAPPTQIGAVFVAR